MTIGENRQMQNHRNRDQITLSSRIRISQGGSELLDFIIPLGAFDLHVSAVIPGDGTDEAPVYVLARPARRTDAAPSPHRSRLPLPPPDDASDADGFGNS